MTVLKTEGHRHDVLLPVLVALLGVQVACASNGAVWSQMDQLVAAENYADAARLLEGRRSSMFPENSDLLYHLEQGMLLHLAGDPEDSNEALEEAKDVSERLATRSLSREAASFLTSDRALDYDGEGFERALVHVLAALNYTLLDDSEGALVEARQADALLAKLQTDAGGRDIYRDDGFVRYLTGLIYEDAGRWNEAVVAYRQALAVYDEPGSGSRPSTLLPTALAAAERTGPQTLRTMQQRWGAVAPRRMAADSGEVIVLHYNGWAPRKQERFFEISFGKAWAYVSPMDARSESQADVDSALAGARAVAARRMLRVAFPARVDVPRSIARLKVSAAGRSARSDLVADVGGVAHRSLENGMAEITARAAARAAFKLALAEGVCLAARKALETDDDDRRGRKDRKKDKKRNAESGRRQQGGGGQALAAALICGAARAAAAVSERADTRSWRTLPDQIGMSVLALPAGRHRLDLAFQRRDGSVVRRERIKNVRVDAGRRTFVVVRTVQ